MKTEVLVKRDLFGVTINQKSKSEFLSATDLIKAGNRHRSESGLQTTTLENYFKQEKTKEFIDELTVKYGVVKVSQRGRGSHTWVHPILFMDIALWISPRLKVEVYEWIKDNLLRFRNSSGDSYKLMAGAIFSNPNYAKYQFKEIMARVAERVAIECGVGLSKDRWQTASEDQLKLRDKIHEYISFAADITTNLEDAIEIGVKKAKSVLLS